VTAGSVEVTYKCACMPAEVTIYAPYRRSDQDVVEWMAVVQEIISIDHRLRSPTCMRTAMEYAKIPMPENAPRLGDRPIPNS